MIEAIFEGARATCARHPNVLLHPKELECDECKVVRINLSFKPPFSVKALRTLWGVKEGKTYTVVWVIRDGAKEHNERMIGYVFKDTEGHLNEHVFDPIDFVPVDRERVVPGVMIG